MGNKHSLPPTLAQQGTQQTEFPVDWEDIIAQQRVFPRSNTLSNDVVRGRLGVIDEKYLSNEIHLFVSSTFTDYKHERNELVCRVFPFLRRLCSAYGLSFHPVDLRWGVRDESTNDHRTTDICILELERCKQLSVGPFVAMMLGNKYGFQPIPNKLSVSEFEAMQACAVLTESEKETLASWYQLNTNTQPPRYVLVPITTHIPAFNSRDLTERNKAKSDWGQVLDSLRVLLRRAASNDSEHLGAIDKFFVSVTHLEVLDAIRETMVDSGQAFVFVRDIKGFDHNESNTDVIAKYFDTNVDDTQNWLKQMKQTAKERVGAAHTFEYTVEWDAAAANQSADICPFSDSANYLNQFCNDFVRSVGSAMCEAAAEHSRSRGNDPRVLEIALHLHTCGVHAKRFVGRTDAAKALFNAAMTPSELLVVCGQSGVGKTALMASVAFSLLEQRMANTSVIIRFLGTTPGSSTARQLLESLIWQLEALLPAASTTSQKDDVANVPDDDLDTTAETSKQIGLQSISELMQTFPDTLRRIPTNHRTIFVLDSLDQLADENKERALRWLHVEPPAPVSVLLSVLDQTDAYRFISSPFPVPTSRSRKSIPTLLPLEPLSSDDIFAILNSWLSSDSRSLTTTQADFFVQTSTPCPLPLFLTVLYREASAWHSFTPVPSPQDVPTTMPGMIERYFSQLEITHGHKLVHTALGLLTVSRDGLGDDEMVDLLSLNDEVLDDVFQYHTPPLRKLPDLIWKRLRADLDDYVARRGVEDSAMLNWYHRQFVEAARERFVSTPEIKQSLHQQLADYFSGKFAAGKVYREQMHNRFVAPQPLVLHGDLKNSDINMLNPDNHTAMLLNENYHFLTKSAPEVAKAPELSRRLKLNTRRVRELPFHLLQLQDLSAFRDLLCSVDFAQVVFSLGQSFDYLAHLESAVSLASDLKLQDSEDSTLTRDLQQFLQLVRSQRHILERWPTLVRQLALNAPHNSFPFRIASAATFKSERLRNVHVQDSLDAPILDIMHHPFVPTASTFGHPLAHRLVIGNTRGVIMVTDLLTGNEVQRFAGCHSSQIVGCVVSPCFELLLTAEESGTVAAWKWEVEQSKGSEDGSSDKHDVRLVFSASWSVGPGGVHDLSLAGRGAAMVAVARENSVHLFVRSAAAFAFGKCEWTQHGELHGSHLSIVTAARLSPDCSVCVSGGFDRKLIVWDTITCRALHVIDTSHGVNCVSLSPNGCRVASALQNGLVLVHSLQITQRTENSGTAATLSDHDALTLYGHTLGVSYVRWFGDSRRIVTCSNDQSVRVWDTAARNFSSTRHRVAARADIDECEILQRLDHFLPIHNCSVSADDRLVCTSGFDKTSKVIDVSKALPGAQAQFREQKLFRGGHSNTMRCAAFSPDEKYAATGAWDSTIVVWNTIRGSLVWLLRGHSAVVRGLSFHPHKPRLISASKDATVMVWNLKTGREITTFESRAHGVLALRCCSYSQNGTLVACAGSESIMLVWNTNKNQEAEGSVKRYRVEESAITRVTFLANDKRVACCTEKGAVKIFDVMSTNAVFVSRVSSYPLTSLHVSHDDAWVVTTGWDNQARIISLESGEQIAQFQLPDRAFSATFLPLPVANKQSHANVMRNRSRRLVVVCRDCSVRVYNTDTMRLETLAYATTRPLIVGASARRATFVVGCVNKLVMYELLPE